MFEGEITTNSDAGIRCILTKAKFFTLSSASANWTLN